MARLEKMVRIWSTNEMEIKQFLTDGNLNFYFGKIDALEGEEHKQAYINACLSTMTLLKPLFIGNELKCEILSDITWNIKSIKNENHYLIATNDFFLEMETFFVDVYNSQTSEVSLFIDNFIVNIYSDPVVIKGYYGNDLNERKKLKVKKPFLSWLYK